MTALYLRCDKLRPGDVVLTLGSKLHSKVIAARAKSTNSDRVFSHAALVSTGDRLFESTVGDGVAFTPILLDRYDETPNGAMWLSRLTEVDDAIVMRHPELQSRTPEEIVRRLGPIIAEYQGLEYPAFEKLLAAAKPTTRRERLLLDAALSVLQRLSRKDPLAPGPFCSMLVAEIYRAADIALFTTDVDPHDVNPTMLLHSCLEEVPDAVCAADPRSPTNEKEVSWHNDRIIERSTLGTALQRIRREQQQMHAVLDRFLGRHDD